MENEEQQPPTPVGGLFMTAPTGREGARKLKMEKLKIWETRTAAPAPGGDYLLPEKQGATARLRMNK